jgi:hypothetical protein
VRVALMPLSGGSQAKRRRAARSARRAVDSRALVWPGLAAGGGVGVVVLGCSRRSRSRIFTGFPRMASISPLIGG